MHFLLGRGLGAGGGGSICASPSSSIKWIRRAAVAAIVLLVALNLAARGPYGERLGAAAAPWQQLLVASSSTVGDDDMRAASSSLLGGGREGARPAEFEQCGRWQEAYVERHRRILAGELPERYLVAVLHDAGVADQLLGVVTAFYWALLTGRAFQITAGHQQLPPLEAAFDTPFINWTRPLDPLELTEHLYKVAEDDDDDDKAKAADPRERAYPTDGSVDTRRFAAVYLSNNNTRNDLLFRDTDLRTVHPEHAVVFTASNRGRTYRLFDNPYHRRALAEMGLRPETAFGCAFRFLFKPNAAVMQTEAMQLSQKSLKPTSKAWKDGRETKQDVLRIGIQIRAGDWTFDKEQEQSLKLEDYMPFFDCARQIEAFASRAEQPAAAVRWYLISDSTLLRKKALRRFGPDKVVTLTQEHDHVACNVVDCGAHRDQAQALVEAVGDLVSLSKTDYKVLTQKSGFGKVAASLAVDSWHAIYWPDLPIGKGSFHNSKDPKKIVSTVGTCHQGDYVLLEDLSDGWSGVR